MRKTNKKFFSLCSKSLNGELADNEKRLLDELLAASEKNKRIYNELKQVWIHSKPPAVQNIPDIDNEWKKFKTELQMKSVNNNNSIINFIKDRYSYLHNLLARKHAILAYSVAVLFIITGLFLWDHYLTNSSFNVKTSKGERTLITLSDGTKVHLNCESSLQCSDNYNRRDRKVYLEGEAYFEVVKNKQNFIVITPHATTKVLGTKFNVRARGQETRVVVKSGVVVVNKNDEKNDLVKLETGEMGLISGKDSPDRIEAVDTECFLGWMEGKLFFRSQRLNAVVEELNRAYDVTIQISDSTLSDHTLTATFDNLPFTSVIHSICLTLGSEYKYEDDKYIIY